ncbi:hypothetical protein A2454_05845 [Candidatus Peribacteria bacterium RIFOXYC2_FULL_55_14]|nr:MAG: hypothetical protein UY90_C0087G0011 [Candidatus Peregrinibacteria bacterium GW2011_GWA2_54_9]KKW40924.1 MAG: hypothetical protein UY87_C0008G0018 [Candidatus Peribacteria bacterium GW2011_GWC2_54_8]OGJ72083.1 MAG: hypothetical protein A2198_04400 [Candidatus Peribacteria bacterium RIFOXYA1_FULL_56_14]OGJ74096.1 MAG: hypothetical protein A2217_00420 [Candidatus Peribacteria bacterium RIFOXYA2_FULL_55_28]OGJ75527.1 MAG: hypothetical protein A2384_01380 [Candidatus Peribacteria bacterium 
MGQLKTLPNIGKKMEKHLSEIGVSTLNDLKKMGALEAWRRIRAKDPQKDCCICALYALEGAIMGIRWHELPEKVKEALREKANEERTASF